ncbi:MAG: hypothetical protein HY324_01725 [Chlamydiia bacterium]|nr:hypothetical protein [Chlamydiia bacterium]
MHYRILLAITLLFLGGCFRPLSCRSEYLYPSYLASSRVNTPDPQMGAFVGEQIVIAWHLPRRYRCHPASILLHVRYGDHTLATFEKSLDTEKGWWIYRLLSGEYQCHKGILSFDAQLLCAGEVVDEWRHSLWVPVITLSP